MKELNKQLYKEEFLHFVWKYQLYQQQNLKTTTGVPVQILKQGSLNFGQGPDFSNSRIILGETEWAGNIEIHKRSSDWYLHHHDEDAGYNNVVLHVVAESDALTKTEDGHLIPTIEIGSLINESILDNYEQLLQSANWIPCESNLAGFDFDQLIGFSERLLIERLEDKSAKIILRLRRNRGDWEECFHQSLAENLGFKTNAEPMEILARLCPLRILRKYSEHIFQLEALLFGQAGFLIGTAQNPYFAKLQKEYHYLKKLHHLKSVPLESWKFGKLRPSNFPTVRIAQFAAILNTKSRVLSRILEKPELPKLKAIFSATASPFWDEHFHFNEKSVLTPKKIGIQSINNIIINTVSVVVFAYGMHKNEQEYKDYAVELLQQLPAEKNAIVSKYDSLGFNVRNAIDTQGLLQLKKHHCDEKKCVTCDIGTKILKN